MRHNFELRWQWRTRKNDREELFERLEIHYHMLWTINDLKQDIWYKKCDFLWRLRSIYENFAPKFHDIPRWKYDFWTERNFAQLFKTCFPWNKICSFIWGIWRTFGRLRSNVITKLRLFFDKIVVFGPKNENFQILTKSF